VAVRKVGLPLSGLRYEVQFQILNHDRRARSTEKTTDVNERVTNLWTMKPTKNGIAADTDHPALTGPYPAMPETLPGPISWTARL